MATIGRSASLVGDYTKTRKKSSRGGMDSVLEVIEQRIVQEGLIIREEIKASERKLNTARAVFNERCRTITQDIVQECVLLKDIMKTQLATLLAEAQGVIGTLPVVVSNGYLNHQHGSAINSSHHQTMLADMFRDHLTAKFPDDTLTLDDGEYQLVYILRPKEKKDG